MESRLDKVKNFSEFVKANDVPVEAVCLSDKNGIIYCEHFMNIYERNIYSHSKSFTSLLVGIAIDEGKLTFETKMADLLKDDMTEEEYKKFSGIRLIDLLTMSSGIGRSLLMQFDRNKGIGFPDYLKFIFSFDMQYEPGTHMVYSNGDTYLIGRMLEKVYQKPFMILAYEKIFKPMDMGLPCWNADPYGRCLCATGLHLSIENMNKLGILLINGGVWNGKRIVSEEYISECKKTKVNIDDLKNNLTTGYSLQFWTGSNHFRADGMYGQLTYMFEDGYALSVQAPEKGNANLLIKTIMDTMLN